MSPKILHTLFRKSDIVDCSQCHTGILINMAEWEKGKKTAMGSTSLSHSEIMALDSRTERLRLCLRHKLLWNHPMSGHIVMASGWRTNTNLWENFSKDSASLSSTEHVPKRALPWCLKSCRVRRRTSTCFKRPCLRRHLSCDALLLSAWIFGVSFRTCCASRNEADSWPAHASLLYTCRTLLLLGFTSETHHSGHGDHALQGMRPSWLETKRQVDRALQKADDSCRRDQVCFCRLVHVFEGARTPQNSRRQTCARWFEWSNTHMLLKIRHCVLTN